MGAGPGQPVFGPFVREDPCVATAVPDGYAWRERGDGRINRGRRERDGLIAKVPAGYLSDKMGCRKLGDAANYAISLLVVGMALTWRARAFLPRRVTLAQFSVLIIGSAICAAVNGSAPQEHVMSAFGASALVLDLLSQCLGEQQLGDAGRAWRMRHGNGVARRPRGDDHGGPVLLGRRSDHPPSSRKIAG